MLQRFIIASIVLSLCSGAFNLQVAAFQSQNAAVQTSSSSAANSKSRSGKKIAKPKPIGTKSTSSPTSVSQISSIKPDFLSGEATVTVHGNTNTLIRLGLAQGGVTLVEFPSDDPLYAIPPGNQELVTVDVSSKKASDPLIFRPGSGFIAKENDSGPATLITTQMTSGLVCTFLIYPVRQLTQSAYRIVLSYNRVDVVAARRAAGLAVDLGGAKQIVAEAKDPEKASPEKTSKESGSTATVSDRSDTPLTPAPKTYGVMTRVEGSSPQTNKRFLFLKKGDKPRINVTDIAKLAHQETEATIKSPKKLSAWSKPLHGLSIATGKTIDIDESTRLVIVAVHNDLKETVRLLPDSPEVIVQTIDDSKRPVQVETMKKTVVETTALNGVVPPGATVYFALVYESPILGAHQLLQVAVGQRNAADEPAATSIPAGPR